MARIKPVLWSVTVTDIEREFGGSCMIFMNTAT